MTLPPDDDETLRRAFVDGDADVTFGAACPPAEHLWAAARGELSPSETEQVVDHLATCAACARAWSVATEFGPAAAGRNVVSMAAMRGAPAWWERSQPWAMAALVVLAVGLGSAIVVIEMRQRESAAQRIADAARLEAEVAREREGRVAAEQLAQNLRTELALRSGPLVNVPLFELAADALRGGGPAASILAVPAEVSHVTLLLSPAGKPGGDRFAAEAIDATGRAVWRAEGLRPSDANVFTVTVPRTLMPDGEYRLRLSRTAPAPSALIHEYAFTVRTR